MPRTFCLGISLLLLLSACGSERQPVPAIPDTAYPAESGGTLLDAMTGEPSGLIPMIAGESASSAIASHIFNSLLRYDRNLELEGELAESWQISKDQKTITFRLKPDLKWSDGEQLTSADVLFPGNWSPTTRHVHHTGLITSWW